MKAVSNALRTLIESGEFVPFDLYTITLSSGLMLAYTTADFKIAAPSTAIFSAPRIDGTGDLWFPGIAWEPGVIDAENSRATGHWKVGLDSDDWLVTVAPRQADTGSETVDLIGSEPWLAAAAVGVLDRADCVVARAYFAAMPEWPMPAGGAVPVGTTILFRGYLGEIDLSTTRAVLTVNDYRQVLQQQMPRNYYQAPCRLRFGSTRCGISLATYTRTGTASGASTRSKIVATSNVAAPGGSGTYELGILTMTSGANAGFKRTVRSWDGGATLGLLSAFPFAIAAGDTFTVSAGCHKTVGDCQAFGNYVQLGGEPFIPIPEISV